MSMNKKVAIALSCYNHQDFLRCAIESIMNQTYDNWHLFFFDNNSTDYSLGIAQKLKKELKNKMTICQFDFCHTVLPIGVARYLMMQKCFSPEFDYIAILDADDYWRKDKLEKQVKMFEADPKVKLVFSDCYYSHWIEEVEQVDGFPVWRKNIKDMISEKTFHYEHPPLMNSPMDELTKFNRVFENLLLEYNFMPCPTLIFERESLQKVIETPMAYTSAEDYDWILKMTHDYKCDYVREPLAYYRVYKGQLTKKTPVRCTMEEIDVVRRFLLYSKSGWCRKFWRMFILYLKLIYKEILL